MMVEFEDYDMDQRLEGRLAPNYRLYRRGCLHDFLAGSAAILGADGPEMPTKALENGRFTLPVKG